MPDRPSEITWEVMVDWNATDWTATPDFSQAIDDISEDVNFNGWTRGEDTDAGNSPAGTHTLRLKPGLHAKYSLYNAASTLYGLIRPWLPVRIRAIHNLTTYAIFAGFIDEVAVDPAPDRQSVTITITDGADLLARQLITQDFDTRTSMSDGAAIGKVLDAAGWSSSQRNIDTDGGADLLNYPETGVY
jgi:hypothetical protein